MMLRRIPRLDDVPRSLSSEEFWQFVGDMEHEGLDFKESANHLSEPIAAMSMTEGGLLVLGVSDRREIRGAELDQKAFDRINRAAGDGIAAHGPADLRGYHRVADRSPAQPLGPLR